MDTAAIRRELHNYLEVAADKKVKAIYTMMESAIKESAIEYTDELKATLDQRYADYKNGKAKTVTAIESRKRIRKILTESRK
jgi:putative addiction module component (TIGR02574 family)